MHYLISQANRHIYQKNISTSNTIVDAVALCANQRLPFRGDRDDRSSISSNKGNFLPILEPKAKQYSTLREHIEGGQKSTQHN